MSIVELLGYDSPVQHTVRVAMRPIEFVGANGETAIVEPGRIMVTVLGAASRDPDVFDDPHALRLDRPNAGRHTAFSAGVHDCLGASLAKLEAQVAITRLIRRFRTIELAGTPR